MVAIDSTGKTHSNDHQIRGLAAVTRSSFLVQASSKPPKSRRPQHQRSGGASGRSSGVGKHHGGGGSRARMQRELIGASSSTTATTKKKQTRRRLDFVVTTALLLLSTGRRAAAFTATSAFAKRSFAAATTIYIYTNSALPIFDMPKPKSVSTVAAASAAEGGDAPARKKRGRPPKAPAAEEGAAAAVAAAAAAPDSKPKRSRKSPVKTTAGEAAAAAAAAAEGEESAPKAARGGRKKAAATTSGSTVAAVITEQTTTTTTTTVTKPAASAAKATKATTAAASVGRVTIPRAPTPRTASLASLTLPPGRRLLRLVSWNVAGLRGLLRKENAAGALRALLERERPDVLCLQETKLQEDHVAEVSAALKELHLPRFDGNWFCSVSKKGYSGTVVLLSQDSGLSLGPGGVQCGIGQAEGDGEGRVMTVDLGAFALVNVYTPNSGEGLKRLGFRVGTWDRAFEGYLKALQAQGKQVLVCGDLNVAHGDADFFNPGEKRMAKSAGTTPEERASFGQLLEEAGMVDTFRHFHPEATGCYSYWSVRAGNRPYNRGMRLDYFLASGGLVAGGSNVFPRVLDAFIMDQEEALVGLSDHAPVGVVVAV